jgi:tetratricopeptide (TPR) repeat protein
MLASQIAFGGTVTNPNLAKRLTELGFVSLSRRNYRHAKEHFSYSLAIDPDNTNAMTGMGCVFQRKRSLDRAIEWYRRALSRDRNHALAHMLYSSALLQSADLPGALDEASRGMSLAPNSAIALLCLGEVQYALGMLEEAKDCFEQAIMLEPDNDSAYLDLAQMKLLLGEFASGWDLNEHRFSNDPGRARHLSIPRWQGEPLEGRTLLIHAEEGLGNTIQFSRFIEDASRMGGRIVFEAPRQLHALFANLAGVDELTDNGEEADASLQCPLMSLPSVLELHEESQFKPDCYVVWKRADNAGPSYAVDDPHVLNIGICWAGDPHMIRDRIRSMPLSFLAPIAQLPGVALHSLQAGREARSQMYGMNETDRFPIRDHHVYIHDLTLCAAITEMDLVITVDTSVAHLAGAMGAATWLLLPHVPDWRWQLNRSDSPWYASVRLFRQAAPGDWASAISQVIDALGPLLASKSGERN